jgi:hypothetical protein
LPEACDHVVSVHLSDRPLSGTAREHLGETHLAAIRFEKNGAPTKQITLYYPGVVRSPRHAPSGLMQAVHRARELAQIDRSLFVLSAAEVDRLHSVWAPAAVSARQGASAVATDTR